MIHHSQPDNVMYQRIYHELAIGPKTTCQLQAMTGGMAIHSTIAEMRQVGYPISKAKYAGRSLHGKKIYIYELEV